MFDRSDTAEWKSLFKGSFIITTFFSTLWNWLLLWQCKTFWDTCKFFYIVLISYLTHRKIAIIQVFLHILICSNSSSFFWMSWQFWRWCEEGQTALIYELIVTIVGTNVAENLICESFDSRPQEHILTTWK